MKLIYEFWLYDLPTEIVEEMLERMKIPYKEKIFKRKRNCFEKAYDEWVRIYVDSKEIVKWLEKEIEKELMNCG